MSRPISALYTPQEMSEEEFCARFSVRNEILESLVSEAVATGHRQTPRHVIIQGQRGQGKSSLLRMAYLKIRDNQQTQDWLLPLLFNEELYRIGRLYKFWEYTAELLSSSLGFEKLPARFAEESENPYYENDCHLIIEKELQKKNVCLLLLIDNIGELISKLRTHEQLRLRDILVSTSRIRIIGASSALMEKHFDQGTPFHQFFKVVQLTGLDAEETRTLLGHLGDDQQQEKMRKILEENPGRIEALRRLTSGVPRTILLLFEILLGKSGDALHDLENLLDRVTPLYKHQMDDLSVQQQEIVDTVALAWDAVGADEIGRACRMPRNQVMIHLKQLIKGRIIHQEQTSGTNNLYRLEERFFNIWYMMHNGRPSDRRRTLWLVRFLQTWCSRDELFHQAERHLQAIQEGSLKPQHARLLTDALISAGLSGEQEDRLIKATRQIEGHERSSSERRFEDVVSDSPLQEAALKKEKSLLKRAEKGKPAALFDLALHYEEQFARYRDAERYYLLAVDKGHIGAMNNLALLYRKKLERYADAERYFLMAVEHGHVGAMNNLALLYRRHFQRCEDSESYYLLAIERGHMDAMFNLALLYEEHSQRYQDAEHFYLQAVEKGHVAAMFNLALLYEERLQRFEDAETYYLLAAEQGHGAAMANLALLYQRHYNSFEKAEKYYLQAVAVNDSGAMNNLALLYQQHFERYEEAERYYLQAIALGQASAMNNLGLLYRRHFDHYEEAEKYYLLAIQHHHVGAMFNLAVLYQQCLERYEEAEKYYLLAIKYGCLDAMFNLALLYEEYYGRYEDAEKYYLMAIKHDHSDAMFNLALLYEERLKRFENAERYYLLAIEKGHTGAMLNLSLLYFEQAEKYARCLDLSCRVAELKELQQDPLTQLQLVRVLLWGGRHEEALNALERVVPLLDLERDAALFSGVLLCLAAAGQIGPALRLFEDSWYGHLCLQDRFKPIYFALLHKAGREREDDFRRMGGELQETVDEILLAITAQEVKYFSWAPEGVAAQS